MSGNRVIWRLLVVVLAAFSEGALGYEESTHRVLSELAATASRTYQVPDVLAKLGLPGRDEVVYQSATDPERSRSFVGIIGDGAVDEDAWDLLSFCHHFFDPQADARLSRGLWDPKYATEIWCVGPGIESPLWSLEDVGLTSDVPDTLSPTGFHAFSMRRAYAALRRSMTDFDRERRLAAARIALQSLGNVVHHLQDMAQPQHTRNEGHPHHLGRIGNGSYLFEGEAPGGYEIYAARQDGRIPQIVQANPYPAISVGAFATARHFWHTPDAAAPAYTGMAEFTAQNFISYRKSFRAIGGGIFARPTGLAAHPDHPLPNGSNLDGTPRTISAEANTITLLNGARISGRRYYVRGNVVDGLTGAVHRNRKQGVLGLLGRVVEDPSVYEDRLNILLPRAVAFSSAFIDYFFRGRMALLPPTSASAGQWTISNTGQFPLEGWVSLGTENAAGQRSFAPSGASFYVTLQPGAQRAVAFNLPDDARKVVAVFEGRIGNEGDTLLDPFAVHPRFNHVTGDIVDAPPAATRAVLSPASVTVPGSGQAVRVGVTLDQAPRRDETVQVTRQPGGSPLLVVGPSQLTFTAANYQTPQFLNVTGSNNPSSAQSATFAIGNDRLTAVTLSASQSAAAIPCGSTVSAAGGSAGYSKTMDLGTATGTVQVQFEAYGIPDALTITRGSTTVVNTGMVSGWRDLSFQQPSGSPRELSIRVTGNSDSKTQWTLAVSCPGGALSPPRPRVDVAFGTDPAQLCGVSCSTLQICGRYSVTVNGQSTVPSGRSLPMTVGSNVLLEVSHSNPNCGSSGVGTPTSAPGSFYYRDRSGKHYLVNLGANWVTVQ